MDGRDLAGGLFFEGFRLERCGLFRLDRAGMAEPVALGSRALDLLLLLAERHGEVVSKDAILHAVWSGAAVAEGNLTVQVSTLRRVLDRDRAQGSCIQTIPGRGYRFVAAVIRSESAAERAGLPDAGVSRALPSTAVCAPAFFDKPSIAVLPFANLSGDPEQEYFADGMVEEIITALSRIRWLFVIARSSSFTYKGQAIDVKRVGRELGVRYVLEGSVRRAGGRVRITAQLIDATTGTHLWIDRFDGSLEDVFDLQDKVASRVAGVIEPTLQAAETACSAARPTNDLTAYDLYLRAYAMVRSSARYIPEALRLLEQAIAHDPHYGPALAHAAICGHRLLTDSRSEDPEADALKGADFARRALEAAGDDPGTLANAAYALAYFGEDIGAMTALVDRALALNPNYARGWHISGVLKVYAGQPNIAIEHSETALRLSPHTRIGSPLTTIGAAHFFARRCDQAVPKLLLAIQEDPGNPQPYRYLAACYAHMGRLAEAREIVRRLRSVTPLLAPSVRHLRNAEHRELYLSGLRLAAGGRAAGLPALRGHSVVPSDLVRSVGDGPGVCPKDAAVADRHHPAGLRATLGRPFAGDGTDARVEAVKVFRRSFTRGLSESRGQSRRGTNRS
jgi:TolB-like protein/DNA-binding winged helix-turn-helix (wHTH) protein